MKVYTCRCMKGNTKAYKGVMKALHEVHEGVFVQKAYDV